MEARPTPGEDAVRDELREEREVVPEEEVEAPQDGASAGPDGSGPDPDAHADELPAQSDDAERQRDEYLALAQRTQADFDNYRKRAARDIAVAGTRAKAGLARELLPAIDNLERAVEASGEQEQGLAQGVRLVHDELIAALGRGGLERFDPSGERFDPEHHEAIATRPQEGVEAGVVLDVAEKGYRTPDTVVRPARVVVSA